MDLELNKFPKEGWTCKKTREVVLKHIQQNETVTAEQISRAEHCPLYKVISAIRYLSNHGMIKPSGS